MSSISKTLYYDFDKKYLQKDIGNVIKDRSHYMVYMNSIVDDEKVFFVDGEIGNSWATLYYNSFLKSGYTHYDQEYVREKINPIDNPYIATEEEFFFKGRTNKRGVTSFKKCIKSTFIKLMEMKILLY